MGKSLEDKLIDNAPIELLILFVVPYILIVEARKEFERHMERARRV